MRPKRLSSFEREVLASQGGRVPPDHTLIIRRIAFNVQLRAIWASNAAQKHPAHCTADAKPATRVRTNQCKFVLRARDVEVGLCAHAMRAAINVERRGDKYYAIWYGTRLWCSASQSDQCLGLTTV